MNALKKLVVSGFLCALLGSVSVGCNTVHGAGRDIERGGEKIQGEAREQQDEHRRHEQSEHDERDERH